MKKFSTKPVIYLTAACALGMVYLLTKSPSDQSQYFAPIDIQLLRNGQNLIILSSEGNQCSILNAISGTQVKFLQIPVSCSGMTVRDDTAYITTKQPAGRVLVMDIETGTITKEYPAGHTPVSPVISSDGNFLCVANRFSNTVSIINIENESVQNIETIRQPIALTISNDDKLLFVANHLPVVRPFLDDENPYIGAEISVIDIETAKLIRSIELPNGSQGLRDITISPDSKYVAATHILSNYTVPPREIEHGRINMNAVSLIDAVNLEWIDTIILDDPEKGAANPWSVCFADGGNMLLVTHAGTHELSVIDFSALLERISSKNGATGLFGKEDLLMMDGIRKRLPLPVHGPRSMTVNGKYAYIAGYFSDNICVIDLTVANPHPIAVSLSKQIAMTQHRLGEKYFNDASLCYQQWQSCATCHPDGRSDVMYWDLLNDGLGNTKNTKSLLMSALTPPVMWTGVRQDAQTAVRSGIHHIQFAEVNEDHAEAIHKYLEEMKAVPSPFLNASKTEHAKTGEGCSKCHYPEVNRGILSESAIRGKKIFEGKAGCVNCHPHPLFTNMKKVDPGLGSGVLYDVPSLIEAWRNAPYLHSGDALTIRETITDFNFMQKRGKTKDLTEKELNDLIEYVNSL